MASTNIEMKLDVSDLKVRIGKIDEVVSTLWEKTAIYIEDRIQKQFQASKDPADLPWQRLKLKTLLNRRRLGVFHTKPLIVTGKMLRSFRVVRTKDEIRARIDAPATYHQQEYKKSKRGLPQRKIFPNQANAALWSRDITDFLTKQFNTIT